MARTRRQFLRSCVALGAASQLARFGAMTAHARSGPYKALVCVFLFGGNDSNNTIIPVDSRYSAYAAMRGPVALSASSLLAAGGSGYAFHPALPNVRSLFQRNVVANVFNVGTLVQPTTRATFASVPLPRSLRSHTDQTQQWQSSDPTGGFTGWGGRVSEAIASANTGAFAPGITVSNENALFLSGATTEGLNVSGVEGGGLINFGSAMGSSARYNSLQRLLTFNTGLQLVSAADGVLDQSLRSLRDVNAALAGAPALPVTFPNTQLGQQLALAAKLIQVRGALGMNRQIFFAGLGGFDHHESLLGSHSNLLSIFDGAANAFFSAMESFGLAEDVTLFTESEFNRTGDANASLGTDHAWGGHQLVIGGAVRGSLHGTFPTLQLDGPDDMGGRGTWIPTTSLDQYAGTLARWFGVGDAAISTIFPNLSNFSSPYLNFLGGTDPLSFTDESLITGQTLVRTAHLSELRTAINSLRARYGVATVTWTDATLVPGITLVKRAHLMELRTALTEVFAAAGRTPPTYTDTPTSGLTIITANHIQELRSAIRSIW